MKLIITLTTLLLTTLSSFSQPAFSRAYSFVVGYKETNDSEITWSPNSATQVDILIVADGNLITIYSNEIQKYHVVKIYEEGENFFNTLVVDANGIQCIFKFGYSEKYETFYNLIEYSNFAWIYLVNPQK
jgi:hypothetical protein